MATLTLRISAPGIRQTLAKLRGLPKDVTAKIRDASGEIAQDLASTAKAASGIDAQSAAVGKTVKVIRDRVPAVQAGGSQRVTSSGAPAHRLLFGSEFGADGRFGWYGHPRYSNSEGRQFVPHQGTEGRWFFPSVEAETPNAMKQWGAAVDQIVADWGGSA